MQFTTVRSKEKDYDIYLKSEKLVHSQQEHEKNISQLFGSGKNWFLAISSLTNTVAAIWRDIKVNPCYLEIKKFSSQLTVTSQEKDYDFYLKSEKLVHSQQEHEKNVSKLFGSGKNWFLAIQSLTNTVAAIWREKSGFLLFGDQNMQFTTVRSKEKDYDIYLKSEKLVHSQQEHKKMFPSYLEVGKTGSQLFRG